MMTDPQPPFLTEGTDEALIFKLAEAYNRAETPESEAWVRAIAERTSHLLTEQAAQDEPGDRRVDEDVSGMRE